MAKTLLDALVASAVITANEVGDIQKEAKEKNVSVETVLYEHGIKEIDVAEAKSKLMAHPVSQLEGGPIPFEVLRGIPEESAHYYKMVPLGIREGNFEVGMLAPEDVAAQEALKFISARVDMPVKIFIITPSDFQRILEQYKSIAGEITSPLGVFEKEHEVLKKGVTPSVIEKIITEEAPVTKILSVILRHAVEGRASDVHIEPVREQLRVRFRVDGVLHTSLTLPSSIGPGLASRVKVMTNLKIDETRIPQDGRFRTEVLGRGIDFRVSTLPTALGEKIAIRILDPGAGFQRLEDLGLDGHNLEAITNGISRPYGLILITGPTGSGKSTTLYTLLRLLNKETINIVSLEDPVEYLVPGVNQSQIRPEIKYDFATGIRHVVRQDPDIIMVGEIRDNETAGLAIHAALTGHLVLSTIHTNTAIGAIPRLIDMGVDPFLLPPTLVLVVGQRLVRKLCEDSRQAVPLSGKIKEMINQEIDVMPEAIRTETKKALPREIYKSGSSAICPKGTRGRLGIFEILMMTPQLEGIILGQLSEQKILEEAKRQEMLTMKQDGIRKVLRGVIGLEELLEVI